MKIAGIIPARYASTRFPGKPLADIGGKSLIQRVYEQAKRCNRLHSVAVATDDERIASHVQAFGGEVVMTLPSHQNGTERCAEAAEKLPYLPDAVINIQGDEPFILPEQIDQVAASIAAHPEGISTLIKPLHSAEAINNPAVVKAVKNLQGRALYFSRQPIPHHRDADSDISYYKHLGIYGYPVALLKQLVGLQPTPLEMAEKLEQLRWLEHDIAIFTTITQHESVAVDNPEDIHTALQYLRHQQ